MSFTSIDATERVTAFINRTHGTDFVLDGRLPGGMQSGAYALRAGNGSEAVLKWNTDRDWVQQMMRARPVVAAARAAGWPTPAWLFVGTTPNGYPYHVQERAPGAPAELVTRQLVRAVLPVLDLQAGLRPDTTHDWSDYDHAVVFEGESGFTSGVAAFSAAGADFVEALNAWVAPHRGVELPKTDLVHGDFNLANILLTGDRISALIDVEAAGRGSRQHDLATLLVCATLWGSEPGACDVLLAYARRTAAPGEFEVSLASSVLGILEFMTKHHAEGVGKYLRAATGMLPWLDANTSGVLTERS